MDEKIVIKKIRESFGKHNEKYSDDELLKAYEGTLILSGIRFGASFENLVNKIFFVKGKR